MMKNGKCQNFTWNSHACVFSRARIMSTVDDNWELQWQLTMSVVIVSRLWGWVGDGWQLINIKIIKSMVGWLGWRWQGNLIVQNSNWVIRKASKSCQSGWLKTHETFIFDEVYEGIWYIYAAAAWWKHIGNTYAKWKHIWNEKTERIAEAQILTLKGSSTKKFSIA